MQPQNQPQSEKKNRVYRPKKVKAQRQTRDKEKWDNLSEKKAD